jgi:hypothetical protein
MTVPAEELYSDADHDADTIPSDVRNVVPEASTPKRRPQLRFIAYAGAACFGTLLLALCIATTVEFVVDLSWYGGGFYGAGVVLSAATLGAITAAVLWTLREMRR